VAATAKRADPSPPVREAAIDALHLARMTLGEPSLEREVLALFDRQAEMLLPRIRQGSASIVAATAHTLKGSALGIGAFAVARAAEAVERAPDAELNAAVEALSEALAAASAEIARRLREADRA
jgi:HPt (histidine-containing phosphotransfer) domain-containing protein